MDEEGGQLSWDHSSKGRHTYQLLPNIKNRMKMKHLVIDRFTSQLLTGHGNFAAKLPAFSLKPISMCECGLEEKAEHVLISYEGHIVLRK